MFFPGYSQIPFFDFTFVVISQHSRVFPFHLWLDTDHARTNNMKQPKWENRKKNEDGTFPREHPRRIFPNSRTSHFRRRRSKPRGGIFHFSYEYLRGFGSKISSNITIPLMLVGSNINKIVILLLILDPKPIRYFKTGCYKNCPVD
jgi:hypothetical protein